MKTLLRVALIGATFWIGGWIWADAQSFYCVLHPSPGHAVGCYTGLETYLGLASPTDWIRPTEYIIVWLLMAASFAFAAYLAFARWREKRNKPAAAPASTI